MLFRSDKKYRYILNLTPEVAFQNTEVLGPLFKKWQLKAQTDTLSRWITNKFQHRPAVELYDLEKDKYCMNNIAGKPSNKAILQRMNQALKEWMASCGDEGQATEMKALDHQFKNPDGTVGGEN